MTTTATSLTFQDIESTIQALPVQNRAMLQLMLLQYLDVTQDEIDYMAADQPDSRFLAGNQPKDKKLSLESVRNVTSRANQYKGYYRQKRERPGMHVNFLKQWLGIIDRTIRIAERLLLTNYEVDQATVDQTKSQAPSVLIRQELRALQRAWDGQELEKKDYEIKRLLLEYQKLLRRRAILRRRLKVAQQDFLTASSAPLKDHEIAHIWGIPLGSLAARKVKALHQYLSDLQSSHGDSSTQEAQGRTDWWKETFSVLAQRPIEPSIVEYDGLERTEERLLDKLRTFLRGDMTEPEESKFWNSITKVNDTEYSGTWHSHARSILAFQRLRAILHDMDFSDEALEEELTAKITPQLPDDQLATPEDEDKPVELSEMGLGVLNAFSGEIDDKRSY